MTKTITEHWENLFRTNFLKESDRASVILSVALLDRALETLLKTRLVHITSSRDSFLEDSYAPIATFSARIDLTYRIGLISKKFCRDLHIIRRIRNDFSHNITGCSFEDSSVRCKIVELIRSSKVIESHPEARKKAFVEGAKGDFQITVSWMLWSLWSLTQKTRAIEEAFEEWGYKEPKKE